MTPVSKFALQSSLRSRPNTYKLPASFRRSFFRFFDFLDWSGSGRPDAKRTAPRARLGVEALENRTAPALLVSLTGTTVTLDETAGLQNDDTNAVLPAAFSSRLTALGADPSTAINAAVSNGNVISISGGTGTVAVNFTDGSGGALDGDTSGLFTNDGEEIFLFADTLDDNIALGKTAGGVISFAVYLEETGSPVSGGNFWSIQYEALEHPDANNPDDSIDLGNHLAVGVSEELNFSFAGAPSGSNLFMTFGNPNSTQIVVIGRNPLNQSEGGNITTKDVLNISQAGSTTSFGVNGQQLNPVSPVDGGHEGAIITYVSGTNTNFLVPNLDQNEADVEANIDFQNVVDASTASFTVNQTNPGIGPVTVKISAFSTATETGVNYVDGLTNDTPVSITSASVVDFVKATGNSQFFPAVTVNGDGTLTVTGLSTGDKVSWSTSGTHNRVLIENISNDDGASGNDNNTFDIGGFSIATPNAASVVVGTAIHFEDDGPTAGIAQGAATVAHDETAGIQGDANDTADGAVAALFAGVANVSTDLSPAGFAQNASPVVSSTSSFGTDSVGGTTVFSLAVSAAGVDSGLDTTDGTGIFLFKEGNLVVGRIGGGGGAAAFAVAINSSSGVVSVAQYASLNHPNAANPDDTVSITDGALLAVVTVTDGDGDTATASTGIGDAVQFQDDGPTAGIVQGAPTVAHDETAGIQGDADDTADGAVAALFAGVSNVSTDLSPAGFAQDASPVVSSTGSSFGADQEGGTTAFSLAVSAAGVDSGLDTTAGTSIFLFKEGDLVVGRIGGGGGAAAFAVAINSSSGVVSVAQYASLKHPNAADPDDSVSITDGALLAVVTVTDGDGDTATSSTGIGDALQFQDDGPTLGPISDSLLNWVAGNTVTKSLNGVVGADDPATFTITSFPATLTVGDGTPAQLTLLGVLSDNGTVVTYFKDADNSGTRNAGDTDFFRLTLSGGNYTFDVLQDPPPAEQNFSFAGAPSGSNLFMIFGDPSSSQIVVTGRNPLNQSQGGNITTKDVLNISQAGSTTSFGVNGQQINPVSPVDGGHEGAIITFVSGTNTNFLVPNLDQNEADVEANIDFQNVFDVTSASFTVNQTNPGIGPVTVKISAFSTAAETGVNFVDGLTNDTPVSITSASVVDFVKTSGNSQFFPAVTVNGDGTLTVTGLSTGDKVTWTTSGTHNRVLIENISNDDGVSGNDNNTFDIGGFSLVQSLPAPDEKLDFTVQIADADGDTANDNTAPFSIGLDGNHDGVFSGFAPQLASSIGSGAGTAVLTDQLLRSVVAQAIDHWRAAGVDAQSLRAMEQAPIHIADIRPGWLGMYSVSGGEIWIDVDAAGWGWSTGSTPAPGRMDLLTVVTHEYGHILGLAPTATGVMQVNLVPGVQALPEALVSTSTVAPVAALASQRVAPGLTPPVGASQVSKLEPSLARATTTVDVTPGNGVREVVLPTFARVTTNGTGIPVRGPDSAMPTGAAAFDLLPAPNLASIPTPGAQASSFADNTAAPWILSEGASEAMSADRLSLQRATDAYFAGDSWMTDLTNRSFDMKAAAALALAFAGFHAGGIERREKRNLSPVLGEEA